MVARFFKWSTVLFCVLFISTSVNAQSIKLGYAWAGKSGMANRVTKGFDKAIKSMAPQIQIEYQKSLPDIKTLTMVIAGFEKSKKGMVILRSNGAKHLGKNAPAIPTFIGGCNHPGQLGAIRNLNAPEGNITGVTYFLPMKTQFEVFQAILPDMNSLVLLGDKNNPSSAVDRAETEKICGKLSLKCSYQLVSGKDKILNAVKSLQGKYSAFVIGNQAEVMALTAQIVDLAGKTPVLSYSSKPVKSGALGGFVADDEKLGMMLAESVIEVLVNGMSIKSVPVKVDPEPRFFLNATTASKLSIDIPYEIIESAEVIE